MNLDGANRGKKATLMLLSFLILFFGMGVKGMAAHEATPAIEQLLPAVGGALVEARQRNWVQVEEDLRRFEQLWHALEASTSSEGISVSSALTAAKKALAEAEGKPEQAYQAISALAKATDAFVTARQSPKEKPDAKETAKTLLPFLEQCLDAVRQNDWDKAREAFKKFSNQWTKVELAIRMDNVQVYGGLESQISLARVALQAEPPVAANAENGISRLKQTLDEYIQGRVTETLTGTEGKPTIADGIELLQKAKNALTSGHAPEALNQIQTFIILWPMVEGVVQTSAPDVYTAIENLMSEAASHLASNPPRTDEALKVIETMERELRPFAVHRGYNAWDAAIVLLREGFEALLVLSALLAFLHRTGNRNKQTWIWGGAAAGLVGSGALALLFTFAMSGAVSGSARELVEGITGLLSVALMLTVGVWLHKKANIQSWNRYIKERAGLAIAAGNMWSLFLLSCLAILREGGETVIFYIGMAPAIQPAQLVLGIGAALALLLVLGFVIVRGVVRIPIRPFFLAATILIYYLVFKFLGESVHSLQVAGKLDAHVPGYLPSISWLGVYPTWETTIPQLAALFIILVLVVRVEWGRKRAVEVPEAPTA